MDVKPIKTSEDHQSALEEIARLFDASPDTPEGDRLEVLVTLVVAYEDEHYPISPPSLAETVEYRLSQGWVRHDDGDACWYGPPLDWLKENNDIDSV